jgi:putative oxidoreductase
MSVTSRTSSIDPDLALLILRIGLVLIFPISAYYKIIGWPGIVGMLTSAGAPLPLFGGYVAIGAELLGAALVAFGLFARTGAVILILYVIGTTVIAHRFWEFEGAAQFGQLMSFLKNLCMIAGLGLIVVFGPGRYAVRG